MQTKQNDRTYSFHKKCIQYQLFLFDKTNIAWFNYKTLPFPRCYKAPEGHILFFIEQYFS